MNRSYNSCYAFFAVVPLLFVGSVNAQVAFTLPGAWDIKVSVEAPFEVNGRIEIKEQGYKTSTSDGLTLKLGESFKKGTTSFNFSTLYNPAALNLNYQVKVEYMDGTNYVTCSANVRPYTFSGISGYKITAQTRDNRTIVITIAKIRRTNLTK